MFLMYSHCHPWRPVSYQAETQFAKFHAKLRFTAVTHAPLCLEEGLEIMRLNEAGGQKLGRYCWQQAKQTRPFFLSTRGFKEKNHLIALGSPHTEGTLISASAVPHGGA